MATSDHLPARSTAFRLIAALAVTTAAGLTGLALASQPAAGQASISMGQLTVPDANTTANGSVTDVRLTVDAAFQYDVVDAERVILSLTVGPSATEQATIDFRQPTVVKGQHSGSATFDASVLDAAAFSASDFEPPIAGSKTVDMVVGLTLEVRRANGDPVTATVTEPVTVTVNDDATLSASVGGDGSVDVLTG